jgi:hypothetical protein
MSSSTAPAPERERVAWNGEITPSQADAPLWLLAGVDEEEGAEPHIWRGID